MKLAVAQADFPVGDITGNFHRVLKIAEQARAAGADLVLFPELALTGYPPEDLLLRPGFMRRSHEAFEAIQTAISGIDIIIGHPWEQNGLRFNAASWISEGRTIGRYFKQCLPNYAVFDERRYFSAGDQPLVVPFKGVNVGVMICEDLWESAPAQQAAEAGAQVLLVPNASPYRDDKLSARHDMLQKRHKETCLPVAYCNLVGGQDELVFDGRSMLLNASGDVAATGAHCEEQLLTTDFDVASGDWKVEHWPQSRHRAEAEIYPVLVRGLSDYVHKNNFTDVVFGLSGGVDSALTLALSVDALGAQHVHAVMMPSRHTSQLSLDLAREQAEMLGVDYRTISIEPAFEALMQTMAPEFRGHEADITEENLQARIRGSMIMALSNKFGWLPLATGNKSELAVGYSTIYGDMCGGFSPIKDCLKTRVFDLCRFRNSQSMAIPEQVITRAPSAELKANQTDQDSLPPYELLDQILHAFVDQDRSIAEIVATGFEEAVVRHVAGMVLRNEYKRRQAAPGVRITSRNFGRDRRYPITSGWRESGAPLIPEG